MSTPQQRPPIFFRVVNEPRDNRRGEEINVEQTGIEKYHAYLVIGVLLASCAFYYYFFVYLKEEQQKAGDVSEALQKNNFLKVAYDRVLQLLNKNLDDMRSLDDEIQNSSRNVTDDDDLGGAFGDFDTKIKRDERQVEFGKLGLMLKQQREFLMKRKSEIEQELTSS